MPRRRIQPPAFVINPEGLYKITLPYPIKRTGIQPAEAIDTRFIALNQDGDLLLKAGFLWDGPSGPAWDTVNALAASAGHDALYWLIDKGYLAKSHRRAADKLYSRLLKQSGMGWVRRSYHFLAVRLFGWAHV